MPLSTTTWKEIDGQVRSLTGATDYADPNETTMMRWGNLVINKIQRLLTGVDKPWGRSTSTLSLTDQVGLVQYPNEGITFTASTLAFNIGTNAGLDQSYVGGWVFWKDGGTSRAFYGLIDTVSTTATVVRFAIGTGVVADVAASDLFVMFKPNPAYYSGANLQGVSILDVVKVVDGTNGNVIRLDSDVFASFKNNPNFDSSVVTEYAGDALYLGKGTSVSALGTQTITFDERPDVITGPTSVIDLLPEHLSMFVEELCRWTLNYTQKPIPNNLENPLKLLEDAYKKNAETLAMRTAKRFTPGVRN